MPMLMQSQAQIGGAKVADLSGRNEQSSHGQKLQTPHDQDHVHQPWDRDQLQHPWDRDQLQHQLHDREQLNRDKMQQQWDRDREREKLNKFQSISNLLLDLPSPASFQGYSQDTNKSNNVNDMSITDLFGLGMPWGLSQGLGIPSFMNNQSTSGSPGFRNHQHQNRSPGSSQHYQCEDTNSLYSNSSMLDVPSSPSSIATPSSPSTTSSLYSNPYSFTSTNNNNNNQTATSPTSRGSMQHIGSPTSPIQSPYFGRPIRGSTPYSDCGSPTFDYGHGLKCNGSRSNSPADSETSGNCQSVNSPGYYSQSLVSRMSPEDVLEKNRAIALQRMRKYFVNRYDLDPRYAADRVVRSHQNAAALCNPTCTWRGVLPPRTQYHSGYSSKVFLGGVPWDITESLLIATFKQFGQVRVDWPGKDQSAPQPKGHVYIIFESEKQVRNLLQCCTHDFTNGGSWYYKVSSKRMKAKEVQVIPWAFEYSNYVRSRSHKLDPDRTVYVGALHGMLTASDLAKIMDDLFHGVIYAGIDTDKHKYPIGSGRVTFKTKHSYMKAVATAFVEIKTPKFTKKVQVDPYLEDSMCSECSVQQGPYFCRDAMCLRHFCRICWQWQHWMETMWHHEPLMRDSKTHHVVGLSPSFNFPEYHRALMNNAAI